MFFFIKNHSNSKEMLVKTRNSAVPSIKIKRKKVIIVQQQDICDTYPHSKVHLNFFINPQTLKGLQFFLRA